MSQHTFRQHYRSFSTLRRGRAFAPGSLLNGCNQVEVRGNGSAGTICARSRVNLTKAAILAVMREFDRPVSSAELYAIWDGEKPLEVFEYHLLSLVTAGVAEPIVTKSEILFQLVSDSDERNQKASKGAVPFASAEIETRPGQHGLGQGIHLATNRRSNS